MLASAQAHLILIIDTRPTRPTSVRLLEMGQKFIFTQHKFNTDGLYLLRTSRNALDLFNDCRCQVLRRDQRSAYAAAASVVNIAGKTKNQKSRLLQCERDVRNHAAGTKERTA